MISRLTWIKRRARRIEKFYGAQRRLAIVDAALDWAMFMPMPGRASGLVAIQGGAA